VVWRLLIGRGWGQRRAQYSPASQAAAQSGEITHRKDDRSMVVFPSHETLQQTIRSGARCNHATAHHIPAA